MSRSNVLYVFFFILALILLFGSVDQREAKANFLGKTIFYPFISSVKTIEEFFTIKEENSILIDQLARELIKSNFLENQLEKYLGAQVDYSTTEFDHVLASIVGFSGVFEERSLIIDKGSMDGIIAGYPVITTSGVVGKIESVSLNHSIVLPYNHSTFKLGVMSSRNKLQGMLISDIFGNSYMSLIKLGADVLIGDTIVTSNISSIFPANFPVGKVSLIKEHSNQIHMLAQVDGFTDPVNLSYVIILKYKQERAYETELLN